MHSRIFRYFRSKRLVAVSIIGVLLLAAVGTNATAAGHHFINLFTSVFYSDTTSGPVVEGIQNGSGDGVEGVVGVTTGAIGILGYGNNNATQNIGLEGLVNGPNSVGLLGQALSTNAGTPSIGLEGTSANGVGVVAQSLLSTGVGLVAKDLSGKSLANLGVGGGAGVLGSSGTNSFFFPGVDGESSSHGGGDAGGAFGLSIFSAAPANWGILSYGSTDGVFADTNNPGTSTAGFGVAGFDGFGSTSVATGDLNAGVMGSSNHGTGLLGVASGASTTLRGIGRPIGVYGVAKSTGGSPAQGFVSVFEGTDAPTASIVAINTNLNQEVDVVQGTLGGSFLLAAFNGGPMFTLDTSGNAIVTGHLTANGVILAVPGHSGITRAAYAPRSTVATVEDVGEAQLVNGQAYVRLDAALADQIDTLSNYLVFITPAGDSRGLYVTNRSPQGFSVRENQNGHSNLAFDYRIVAKPAGASGARLAVLPPQRGGSVTSGLRRVVVPNALTPQDQLMQRAGGAEAASAVARYRQAEIARRQLINRLPHTDIRGTVHLGQTSVAVPH